MKLLLFCLLLFVSQIVANEKWTAFKKKHSKIYDAKEEAIRLANFVKTDARIRAHNARYEKGLETYTMGHNIFSDMTDEQKQRYLGSRAIKGDSESTVWTPNPTLLHTALPKSVDLRSSKCMPPMKNQGQCGSCWSFSATAPIEYQKCMKTGKLTILSEQQLVDCTYATFNVHDGCGGGYHSEAWAYLFKAGGQIPRSVYPYKSGTTGTWGSCKFSSAAVYAKLKDAGTVIPQNETLMQYALVAKGPLAFAYLTTSNFYNYKSGVYSDSTCPQGNTYPLNHEMVIVGYGVQYLASGVTPYWIVRNQWGTGWGKGGYVFIRRGVKQCGIDRQPGFPTVV